MQPQSALWEGVWREPGTSGALGSSELCGPHSLLLKHGVEGLALERGCALIKTPAVVSRVASGDSRGCGVGCCTEVMGVVSLSPARSLRYVTTKEAYLQLLER